MSDNDTEDIDDLLEDLNTELKNDELFQLEEKQSEAYETFLFESTHMVRKALFIIKSEHQQADRTIKSIFDIINIRKQKLVDWHGFDSSEEEEKSGSDNSDVDDAQQSMASYDVPAWDPRKYRDMKDLFLRQMDADKKTNNAKVVSLQDKLNSLSES